MTLSGKIGGGLIYAGIRVLLPIYPKRETTTIRDYSGNGRNLKEIHKFSKPPSAVGGLVRGAVGDTLINWGYNLKSREIKDSVRRARDFEPPQRGDNQLAVDVYQFFRRRANG